MAFQMSVLDKIEIKTNPFKFACYEEEEFQMTKKRN